MSNPAEKIGPVLDRLRGLLPTRSNDGEPSPQASQSRGVPLRLRRFVQPGLQTRFVTTVALLMLCMVTVLVAVTVQYQRRTLRDDLERRVEVLAELVASQPLIRQADPANPGLQDVADFLAEQPDIDFALLLTPDNEVLIDASGSSELVGQTVIDESGVVEAAVAGIQPDGTAEPAIREYEGAIHVAQPIVVNGQHVRTVDFAVSLNDVNAKSASLLIRGLMLGLGFLIIGVLATALLVRRITRPLTQLTEAAEDMSRVQIPALVEQLRSGEVSNVTPEVQLIEVRSDDEIGRLGGAFNSIQLTTAEVARSQGELLKRGISDIFVQLARRNQSLIDRQLEVIDDLEASERSPDALAGLFKLDHLAARMRRNAESLLVLADEGSTNVRARPVSMTDMIRVAIGEVEQYHRVEVLSVDDAMVKGAAASGMSHLLAELLDNALRNSPETSRVDVTGEAVDEGYLIRVSDQGVGLSQAQLDEYNELLQSPPEMGLTLSRSLGFTVVSRLARQFELDVSLAASDAGGVTASVVIPVSLLGGATTLPPVGGAPAPAAPLPPPPAPVEPVPTPGVEPSPVASTPIPQAGNGPVPTLPSRESAAPVASSSSLRAADALSPAPGVVPSVPRVDSAPPPDPTPVEAQAPAESLPTRSSVAPPPGVTGEPDAPLPTRGSVAPVDAGGPGMPLPPPADDVVAAVPDLPLPPPPAEVAAAEPPEMPLPPPAAEVVAAEPPEMPLPPPPAESLPTRSSVAPPPGVTGEPDAPLPTRGSVAPVDAGGPDMPLPPPPEGLVAGEALVAEPPVAPSAPVEWVADEMPPPAAPLSPPPEGLVAGEALVAEPPSAPLPPPPAGADGQLAPEPPLAPPPPAPAPAPAAYTPPPPPPAELYEAALAPAPLSPGAVQPLPTRRPGASSVTPQPAADATYPASTAAPPQPGATPMTQLAQRQAPQARSPEQLRQMLNNYRRGQARSRQADDSKEVSDDGPAR